MNQSSLHWLEELTPELLNAAGGKAAGLNQLMHWGLNVPNGFVIINAQKGIYPEALLDYYTSLGATKVAVRSSAQGEDGVENSFAGQYESVLDVEGIDALKAAIDQCVDSLFSQRAESYQGKALVESLQMNVVVQNMVDAASAGVMFTVDPVSGRHDRLVIDAVKGLGEALVSGEVTPDHYEFDCDARETYAELIADSAIVSPQHCQQMIKEAQAASNAAGKPLDLEWAISHTGELFWVQARPITTIGSDLNELDTPVTPGHVLTRCNVGEMMPGACCPLTFATTGRSIENGMQHMQVRYAGRPAITDEWTQVAMSHGKLFLNLSGSVAAASTVLGVDAESLGYSVCGGIVDELKDPPKKFIGIRLMGAFKLLRYLQTADEVIAAFKQKVSDFTLPVSGSSIDIASAIDKALPLYSEAMQVHLQSSTTSGVATNVLQSIISGGQESTAQEQAQAANLMAGASGVESAVLVEQLDSIIDQIAADPKAAEFIKEEASSALAWLEKCAGAISLDYQTFIKRHGHRGYRELCMRELCWADAPQTLLAIIQASVKAKLEGTKSIDKPKAVDVNTLNRGLRWILPKAHNAIRRREDTKSLLVDIANRFKRSYRALGEQLVSEGKLSSVDSIFFFTHQELMEFVQLDADVNEQVQQNLWRNKLELRQVALSFQDKLSFDEICVGKPQAIDHRLQQVQLDGVLSGRPVSSGIIEAKARVALSVAEAASIEPGEILVAPITDVGWTPYFSVISGLITDVGSSVSHGAVIAREYGLPAIVNTRIATQQIKTGDLIRLDANTGIITPL